MTTSEILAFVESVNYAALFFTVGDEKQKFGPGRDAWGQALINLSDEQQEAISERLERAARYIATTASQDEEQGAQ